MSIRNTLFWAHLTAGVIAGLFVLIMSATGVLLTYERQILSLVDRQYDPPVAAAAAPLDADALAEAAAKLDPQVSALVFENREGAPVSAQRGRSGALYLDPQSGERLGDSESATKSFLHSVEMLHRWLAMEGGNRDAARAVMDAANLAFLFLVVSGLYLWLPRIWRWRAVKQRLFLRRGLPTAQARDYSWHHVFGFWALIPLFAITLSGAVFSYQWANSLVFQAYGEQAPQGRGGPRGPSAESAVAATPAAGLTVEYPLQAALLDAQGFDPAWRTISLGLPKPGAQTVTATVDTGTGGQPQKKTTLVYRIADAERVAVRRVEDETPGRQARVFLRFLHTGEVYGLIGQTIAGLASLAACLLVWTGLAQAWRRLVKPRLRARRA